jgi:hypothetical protein
MKKTHVHLSDLHGYSRLAIDATLGVTDLVQAMHHNILRLPLPFDRATAPRPVAVCMARCTPCCSKPAG